MRSGYNRETGLTYIFSDQISKRGSKPREKGGNTNMWVLKKERFRNIVETLRKRAWGRGGGGELMRL